MKRLIELSVPLCAALLLGGCFISDEPVFGWDDDDGGGSADVADPGDFGAPPVEDIVRPSACPGCDAGGEGEGEPPAPGDGGRPSADVGIAPPGAQDFAEFRRALEQGRIPHPSSLDATGFINEHKIDLPPPDCGDLLCLHGMLGVMGNLINGADCTMLMLGLNARIPPEQLERKPLNLVVGLDVSGSMGFEDKLDYAKRGLHLLLDNLHAEDLLTLVVYSSSARVLAEAVDQAGRPGLAERIDALTATGGTALHDGLQLAFEMAQRHASGDMQNRVILVSDGEPTVGVVIDSQIEAMARPYVAGSFRGRGGDVIKRKELDFLHAYPRGFQRGVRGAAPPLPPLLERLHRRLTERVVGLFPQVSPDHYDQVIAAYYPAITGGATGAAIARHCDSLDHFGDFIAGISLQEDPSRPARMLFYPPGETKSCARRTLRSGSLYIMSGPTRYDHDHAIPPVKADRFALTFRQMRVCTCCDRIDRRTA